LENLTKKLFGSSAIVLLIKLFQKSIGIISTLFLARLLTPEDFGIVAIAVVFVRLFDVLSNSGSRFYIIQKTNITNNDLHTAWTIDVITKTIVWIIFLLCTPVITIFYGIKNLENVLYVISFFILIRAFQNPGLYLLRKELKYKKVFYVEVAQKIISFTVVITAAILTNSYWALILGDIASALSLTFLSYTFHSFRPKFTLINFREQWQFAKWMLLKGTIGFFRANSDTFIASKFFPIEIVGGFHLVRGIALTPLTEIISSIFEPLYAAFSKKKSDLHLLADSVNKSLLFVMSIIIPLSLYLSLFSKELTYILLGEQWLSFSNLFALFPIMIMSFTFGSVLTQVCLTLKKVKFLFYFDIVTLSIIVTILLIWISKIDIYEFTDIRVALSYITPLILFIVVYLHFIRSSMLRLLKNLIPIFLASSVSYYCVPAFLSSNFEHNMLNTMVFTIKGGIVYLVSYSISLLTIYIIFLRSNSDWLYIIETTFKVLRKKIT
jgi:lipopolysaccharide exporter